MLTIEKIFQNITTLTLNSILIKGDKNKYFYGKENPFRKIIVKLFYK
jgi:hypothetical protein